MSFPISTGFHCPDSASTIFSGRFLPGGSSLRSAEALCGDGCTLMPFVPGIIEAGSFPVIRLLWKEPRQFLTFTRVFGKGSLWVKETSSCRLMRKPVSRPEAAVIPSLDPGRGNPDWSNMNISAKALLTIWLPGMFIVGRYSVAWNQRRGSSPSCVWWIKSWTRNPTGQRPGSFGSLIMALLIGVNPLSKDFKKHGLKLYWSTCLSMPAG